MSDKTRHDAAGKLVTPEEALKLAVPTASASACLTLYNGPSVKWQISVTFNPNTYPFFITGGSIKGTICGSPKGVVTGGTIGPNLLIHGNLDGGGARLDEFRPVIDRVERVEVGHAARVGDGDEAVEIPVILDRQRDALTVGERPKDVGRDRAAEVRVKLGEASVHARILVVPWNSTFRRGHVHRRDGV